MQNNRKAETMYQLIRIRVKYSQMEPETQAQAPNLLCIKYTPKANYIGNVEVPVS